MNYRVYFVGEDGHFINREDIEAACDEDAVNAARTLAQGQAIEVWQGDRRVTQIDRGPGSLTPGNLFNLFRKGDRRGSSKSRRGS